MSQANVNKNRTTANPVSTDDRDRDIINNTVVAFQSQRRANNNDSLSDVTAIRTSTVAGDPTRSNSPSASFNNTTDAGANSSDSNQVREEINDGVCFPTEEQFHEALKGIDFQIQELEDNISVLTDNKLIAENGKRIIALTRRKEAVEKVQSGRFYRKKCKCGENAGIALGFKSAATMGIMYWKCHLGTKPDNCGFTQVRGWNE